MKRALIFLAGGVIGYLCQLARLPIPFMLGGIIAMAATKGFIDQTASWPKSWRLLALCVAGYGIGRNFTMDTWERMLSQTVGVFAATGISMGLSLLIAIWTHKHTFANLLSCIMGILPGGLTQMMLMIEEEPRADANVVVVAQTLRMFGVVMFVPFLVVHFLGAQVMPPDSIAQASTAGALSWLWLVPVSGCGAFVALKLHVPTATLIGPIIATAIFSCWQGPLQTVPNLIMGIAQLNIGLYMGGMLDKERLLKTKELLPYILGGTAAMIASSVVVAQFLASYYHFSLIAAFLGMAPGGIAEMCLAGMSMGEDVSMILTYQIVRVMVLNLTVPYALHWYFDKNYQG